MADGGGSGGSARARGERPGRVYMGAEGRLGGRGVNHVAGARTAWAARCCDVRRRGGQWRAAVGTPASGNWPPGTVQPLAVVTHSGIPAWRMDRWVRRCLAVHAQCSYGRWHGTRARRRAWARSGVPGLLVFH
jgi:IS5 family transposase